MPDRPRNAQPLYDRNGVHERRPRNQNQRTSLREQVERSLPSWQSWYPSLFDAAANLGLIRARVCSPSSLLLSNRHAAVQSEALQAFKDKWGVEDEPEPPRLPIRLQRAPQPPKKLQKWRR